MIYTGTFRDVKDTSYTVRITTRGEGTQDIILGTQPFVLKTDSDGLFSNLKLREATIQIESKDYFFDVYSSTAQAVKVELLQGETVIFTGYATPNIYSQSYSPFSDTIEIQVVEAVSTLEYYDYSATTTDGLISFLSLLDKCLTKCNCYTKVVYPKSIFTSSTATTDILSELSISENNFFDDDEDKTPWKLKDVLEEILKYLGWSLVVHNDVVYLLDYNYISSGLTDYWEHTINGSTSSITLSDTYTITSASHSGADNKLSLSDTYNKVAIKANLYKIEDLFPDLFEDSFLQNCGDDGAPFNYYLERDGYTDDTYHYYVKFYKNKKYDSLFYQPITHDRVYLLPSYYTDADLKSKIGCLISKVSYYDTNEDKPSSLSWSKWLMFGLGIDGNEASFADRDAVIAELNVNLPIMELKASSKVLACLQNISGRDSYIVINGSLMNNSSLYLKWSEDHSLKEGDGDYQLLLFKLQVGDKFWNGTAWTTTESTFTVGVGKEGQGDSFEWLQVKNKVTFDMGIDSKGYAIPLKNSDKLCGKVNLTIYRPLAPTQAFPTVQDYWIRYSILKDFSINLCTPSADWTDTTDPDTEYSNVISDDYVNEFDEIELKVNSQTEKDYSYSSVLQSIDGVLSYSTSVFDVTLNKSQLQEYNLIEKLYNHYQSTRKQLSLELFNRILPYTKVAENNINSAFVVDAMEIDFANDSATVNIEEV